MKLEIPGYKTFEINNIVLDFNGTIAVDGKILEGVAKEINDLSERFNFYITTADTFGNVEKQLEGVNSKLHKIGKNDQMEEKLDFVRSLDSEKTIAVGNGRVDLLMVKEAVLGVAIVEREGAYSKLIMDSDIVYHSIFDFFEGLKSPKRLIAMLRG